MFLTTDVTQAKKYKELKKREEQIEDYLSKHDSLLGEEVETKGIHQENIVKLLEAISTGTGIMTQRIPVTCRLKITLIVC